MKNPLPKIALLFLLLLPLLGRAQGKCVSGHVVDAETKEPLRFANVRLKLEGTCVIADEYGYFQLESSENHTQDSLIVEASAANPGTAQMEYASASVMIKSGSAEGLRIEVERQKELLVDVRQTGQKRKKSTTATSYHNFNLLASIEEKGIFALPGTQFAFLIKNNPQTQLGNMRSVSFYIGDFCFPRELFRLRVYKADGNGPGTSLLDEMVLLLGPRTNQWYALDLNKFKIPVPENDYFIALEFYVDDGLRSAYWESILEDYAPSGLVMRPYFNPKVSTVWKYTIEKEWKLLPLNNSAFGRFGAMIKVEIDAVK